MYSVSLKSVIITSGDCLRRFLSAISNGIFLPNSTGLISIVEKNSDLIVNWSKQERESITFKAQTFLRLLSFRKIHQVLGIALVPNPRRQWVKHDKENTET